MRLKEKRGPDTRQDIDWTGKMGAGVRTEALQRGLGTSPVTDLGNHEKRRRVRLYAVFGAVITALRRRPTACNCPTFVLRAW